MRVHFQISNMPKERRTHSFSFEARCHASPFPCSSSSRGSSSSSSRNPPESPVASPKDMKEWDEIRCSVCMEYPHNAVLLTCSSGNNGCQPFMCDTSYRHSNCLDQYKKAFSGSSEQDKNVDDQEQSKLPKLSCPLCRGEVNGWTVVEAARRYMNSKIRTCSTESCGFTGPYGELRKHARKDHPSVRPSDADPERQRDWRRMEQRRDLADLFSSMQSAMSGDDGGFEGFVEDDEELGMMRSSSIVRFSSMAFLIIFRFGSAGAVGRRSTSARSSRGQSSRVSSRSQRGREGSLWGETYNGPQPDDMDTSSDEDVNEDEIEGADDVTDGGNADGSNEVAAASRRGPGRPRRQLRMPDDESEDDGDSS